MKRTNSLRGQNAEFLNAGRQVDLPPCTRNVKKLHFVHSVFHVVLKIKSGYFTKEHEAMNLFNEHELCSL